MCSRKGFLADDCDCDAVIPSDFVREESMVRQGTMLSSSELTVGTRCSRRDALASPNSPGEQDEQDSACGDVVSWGRLFAA
mmetsp:Transcript_82851/g.208703  ORF Transcript_82851/g.208703 Transcript_82851/m.208703 type:complete len:81 (+) Transcript_82851:1862-2104(+)